MEGEWNLAGKKTLRPTIDEIVAAVEALDEPARATAVRAACEHLGLVSVSLGAADRTDMATEKPVGATTTPQSSSASAHDIRTFKDQKGPASAIEMACVVAYYLESLASPAGIVRPRWEPPTWK